MKPHGRLSRTEKPPEPGLVHLGLGAFFRSHGALVIEDTVRVSGGDWGIVGASLRSPDIRDRLRAQDFVYTAVQLGPDGSNPRVVSVLNDVLFASDAPEELISCMADASTRIVSLTVTEKGYCHVPSTGMLDDQHPDIKHDAKSVTPRSAVGFIVRALQLRRQAGLRPFTVLSCDNLPDNGQVARHVVIGLAGLIDNDLAEWITKEVCFPATVVDRIVPATTSQNISDLAEETGYLDDAPVFHEPYLQWIIEDKFVDNVRPAFETVAGVSLVEDVTPYEFMKIRMLNGTHSALAYLGYLSGHETIAATIANPVFERFVRKIWSDEIIPTLSPPEHVDLNRYADELLERYANTAILHRTWQIAMDGSQKLPQRILGTIQDNVLAGRHCGCLFLSVAAWMRYVGGVDERGQTIDVRDPLADRLRALSRKANTPDETVNSLLSVTEVFGPYVDPVAREGILAAYKQLISKGAEASIRDLA